MKASSRTAGNAPSNVTTSRRHTDLSASPIQDIRCTPIKVVRSGEALLASPENIAFDPAGKWRAIANARSNAITFYPRADKGMHGFATRPSCRLHDDAGLRYVHDADFSADGSLLATVSRDAHRLGIYSRSKAGAGAFDPSARCSMEGPRHGLQFPAGVAFHPSGRSVAVCNRLGEQAVSFFVRLSSSAPVFGYVPEAGISMSTLDAMGIAAPHGLDFNADGTRLFLCHSWFFMSGDRKAGSAVSAFAFDPRANAFENREADSLYPMGAQHLHSLSCHPSRPIVAVTDCEGGTTLLDFDDAGALRYRRSFDHPWHCEGQGPKGVAFTLDGSGLEITTADSELLVYDAGEVLDDEPAGA